MIQVRSFVCNPFGENTYVVSDSDTSEAALIDPGCSDEAEWAPICRYVADQHLSVRYILLTHGHVDHLMGTGFATRAYGIGVSGSLDEMLHLPNPRTQAMLFGVPLTTSPAPIVHDLKEGDTLRLGAHRIDVLDVPGHSPHGLIFYFADDHLLFSGDVLFLGSIGRADFGESFGCNGQTLIEGIVAKLLSLPGETIVYPGHGPKTSIGFENNNNPYF